LTAAKIVPPKIAIKAAITEEGTEGALYRQATTIVNALSQVSAFKAAVGFVVSPCARPDYA
jgi:hypothetical protein